MDADVIRQLLIGIGVDTVTLGAELQQAEGMTERFVKNLKMIIDPLIEAFSFSSAFKAWQTEGNELQKLSNATGESAAELDAWGQAVANSDGSAAAFKSTVASLSRQLIDAATTGQAAVVPFLQMIGVSAVDASGKARKATDVIADVAKAMDRYSPDQRKFLLQKSGFDEGTLQLLRKGSAEVNALLERTRRNSLSDKDIQAAYNFSTAVDNIGFAVRALMGQFMRLFTPALDALARKLEDGVHWVREYSEYVIPALTAAAGVLAVVIGKQLVTAVLAFNAALIANPIVLVIGLVSVLLAVLQDIYVWFKGGDAMFAGFYKEWERTFGAIGAIVATFVALVKDLFNGLMDVLDGIHETFMGIFTLDAERVLSGVGNVLRSIGKMCRAVFRDIWEGVANIFSEVMGTAMDSVLDFLPDTVKKFLGLDKKEVPAQKKNTDIGNSEKGIPTPRQGASIEKERPEQKTVVAPITYIPEQSPVLDQDIHVAPPKTDVQPADTPDRDLVVVPVFADNKWASSLDAINAKLSALFAQSPIIDMSVPIPAYQPVAPMSAIPGGGVVNNYGGGTNTTTNARIENIVINTSATDARGIAADAGDAFSREFFAPVFNIQSGVNRK